MKKTVVFIIILFLFGQVNAENGYRLWLRYDLIGNQSLLQQYRRQLAAVYFSQGSPTLSVAEKELRKGLQGLLGISYKNSSGADNACLVIMKSPNNFVNQIISPAEAFQLKEEGFMIRTFRNKGKSTILITANDDKGILYGVYCFLRLLQTHQSIQALEIKEVPSIQLRILDHWDNLNRFVERGYAGLSIWNWHELPDYRDKRYTDYARVNASVGINGTVLTNVNANANILTPQYLEKVKALADIFRPYGIKVYLTARFSAPIEIGGLRTADPLQEAVRNWWKKKADEIYGYIPDFGGFLVKANSEGQPGPQDYARTQADGANMLADALQPHQGIVMWRAFVYSPDSDDRFKQAYEEFHPLDGQFKKNVLIQVKNGPIDFQPREPFSPMFGAMPKTPLMMEFQLTQEYLGQGTHLVFEAPMFKECLEADTYEKGKGSTVAKVIDGSLNNFEISGMAAVANIGNEINWTNHPFGQANWYALGRLAWDHELSASQIAREWIRQTFSNDPAVVEKCTRIMMMSHEAVVNYMTPLGLHHIMNNGHHYGPAPWAHSLPRPDWNPVYYHRADTMGIGFDRTKTGSNALSQYAPAVQKQFEDIHTCNEKYLLWFHHVSWQHTMHSGRTLWDELCFKYQEGVDSVRSMQKIWKELKGKVDRERFNQVNMLLAIQEKEAVWWRDACLSYFQTFSRQPIPEPLEKPKHTLAYYQSLSFPYAPGN
ncbi:MAG: alpha-glucuronidase [Terrimonas sp.]|nr:alpha-glucuronidase [Terrimonas sp.]